VTAAPPVSVSRSRMSGRDLRSIGVFIALAFGLSWLVALPLWLGDGLSDPLFLPVSVAVMTTPSLAALAVVFFVEKPGEKAWALGLWPLKPVRRVLGYSALGVLVSMALVLVALPVGALLGAYPADFVNFSAFQQVLDEQRGTVELAVPIGVLIAVQLLILPLASLVNVIPALGEELGWRGWLLPKLMPLGTLPALLVSGVIWGTWHAPLVLLGYNYGDAPGWLGITMMVGMCVLIGAVFGWLRLRSGSVWPAALAHAAFNGAGSSYVLFAMAGEHVDTTQATVLGWSGWIVPLALVAVLIATGQFTPAKQPSGPLSGAEPS
jgi:uncharacterized protein